MHIGAVVFMVVNNRNSALDKSVDIELSDGIVFIEPNQNVSLQRQSVAADMHSEYPQSLVIICCNIDLATC